MTKNPVGRPKKAEQEKKVTLTISVKKKHKKEFQAIIEKIAKDYK
jgi:hypothetical protein